MESQPSRWQMSSISEDESLELGGCWLELGHRSINVVPSDPWPLWYPQEFKTISTERIRARYNWPVEASYGAQKQIFKKKLKHY